MIFAFKKIFITGIIVIASLIVTSSPMLAATPTPVPDEATPSGLLDKLKKIEVLKDKIATKVAELRKSEKGAVGGKIKTLSDKSITLTTRIGEKSLTYSDDTTFFTLDGATRNQLDVRKLKVDDTISAIGYFEDSGTLIAKYVYSQTPLLFLSGKISNIEKSNYTVTIKDAQGETLADIETYSQMFLIDPMKGLVKGGFSKLAVGSSIHALATPNSKEVNRVSIRRLITLVSILPQETGSLVSSPSATVSPKITPKSNTSTPSAIPTKKP
ncbi:hypothetical protein HYW55_01510 [Candidatus Gottesmanbacteria bacterium]|nr:hypothetical protein [Candidatus Gottesmanbacteria bacterium]